MGNPFEEVNSRESLEAYHEKMKALLGDKYDEDKVDECLVGQESGVSERIYNELKDSLGKVQSESAKNTIIQNWFEKYEVRS